MSAPAVTLPRQRTEFHTLTVTQVDRLCEDAAAVTFEVPAHLADAFDFAPGQSLVIKRTIDGREERRNYSICAPAGAAPRIGVREIPGGLFSQWLAREVKAGDVLEVSTPTGNFTPNLAEPAHHVLVVAGSGITPALSIAASVLQNRQSSVTLIYGNRRTSSVMFADELADLKDRYQTRFELVHVLSREPRESELFSGRLDAERLRRILPELVPVPEVGHWWLCGPFDMVNDAQSYLQESGVARSQIHHELFYVGDTPPPQATHDEPVIEGAASEVTVMLDGRSTTVAMDRHTTILDGAQKGRPDLPFACKGGVCGTCRAKVTCGTTDMRRNFALEDEEVEQGFVLTCQTYPVSDTVKVDFDS